MGDGDGGHSTLAATEEPATPGTAAAELAPTTRIGRYQIERRLGAGGMGVVYAAYDIHLRRSVAIKIVGSRIDAASGQNRLVHEAQLMAKLRHPNLATVHDMGISGDRLFVVMELVDGGTLIDWLTAKPRSWREIVAVYLQAARGLAAAHAAGFVHRDFKPSNVLMGTDGIARVSDFGVARLLAEEHTEVARDGATVVGTAGYIAPEIIRGEPVDHRADQFSFCVALHTSLHGERPFEPLAGPRRIEETLGRLRAPSRSIIPRWLQAIINRGLAADPRDRWPTIATLAAAIERRSTRRPLARILISVGVLVAAAIVLVPTLTTRATPTPVPDWVPVAIARDSADAWSSITVSRDGSTLATLQQTEAWVEPRAGDGPRRRVGYPVAGHPLVCKLSRKGDQLVCAFDVGEAGLEIWAIDVATGHADRRVPSPSAPTKPWHIFDVGPDGSIVFVAADFSAIWRVDPSGAVTQIIAAGPGEQLRYPVWSPDGTRVAYKVRSSKGLQIKVIHASTRAVTAVSDRFCKELQWLSETSLACGPLVYRRPVVIELPIPSGEGEARERVRYQGPEYHLMSALVVSDAGILLSTMPNEQHMARLALDGTQPVTPIASGGVGDLPATGWTPSGLLIFGANVRGRLRIIAAHPDGSIEQVHAATAAEVPLAMLGNTILFGRFPGGESTIPFFEAPIGRRYPDGELFQLEYPGGTPRSLGSTRGFQALLCAAASRTCLLLERSGGDVITIDWDPTTGTRGRQRARWASAESGLPALSPDGTTLVKNRRIDERDVLSFLDLESGTWRDLPIEPWRAVGYATWEQDGRLLALATAADGSRWIVRIRDATTIERVAPAPATMEDDDFRISPDGKTAAIMTSHPVQTHWWIARSRTDE